MWATYENNEDKETKMAILVGRFPEGKSFITTEM